MSADIDNVVLLGFNAVWDSQVDTDISKKHSVAIFSSKENTTRLHDNDQLVNAV
jgi:hypothetical protein